MSDEYEAGLRDGKLKSLETVVRELTVDVNRMKLAVYALCRRISWIESRHPELVDDPINCEEVYGVNNGLPSTTNTD